MIIFETFDLIFTQIEHVRILLSFQQNVSDALFYSLKGKSLSRFLSDLFLSFVFVAVLCSIKFFSFLTFNVALNVVDEGSDNQTNPQTYIISTASRKLKYLRKTVTKKYDEINLFDGACKDVDSRFTFIVNSILSALLLYQTNGLSGLVC